MEEEHVFPKSWYPEGTSPTTIRPKVPSCRECNRRYGRLEERLQRVWAAGIDPRHPAVRGIWPRVLRSMSADAARDLRDKSFRFRNRSDFHRRLRVVPAAEGAAFPGLGHKRVSWVPNDSGLLTKGSVGAAFASKDVAGITKKFVRGLYRFHCQVVLPKKVLIETFVIDEEAWEDFFEFIRDRGLSPRGAPPGFFYWYGLAEEDPAASLWCFVVWGHICLQALTRPPGFEERWATGDAQSSK